jgi:hypothetical protein
VYSTIRCVADNVFCSGSSSQRHDSKRTAAHAPKQCLPFMRPKLSATNSITDDECYRGILTSVTPVTSSLEIGKTCDTNSVDDWFESRPRHPTVLTEVSLCVLHFLQTYRLALTFDSELVHLTVRVTVPL